MFNVLQRWAGQTAALDIGYNTAAKQAPGKFVYLLNADETLAASLKGAFVVYQGKPLFLVPRPAHLLQATTVTAERMLLT